MYFALTYNVVEDYANRRMPYRHLHLAHAKAATERGELVLGGAFDDPVDGALIILQGPDRSVAEAFATNDPYVLNGLVASWTVRPWTVVIGSAYDGEVPG